MVKNLEDILFRHRLLVHWDWLGNICLRLFKTSTFLLLSFRNRRGAMLYEQVLEMALLMPDSKADRCHASFVCVFKIAVQFEKELDHFKFVLLNSIINRCLAVLIHNVVFRAQIHKKLDCIKLIGIHSVVEGILAVSIHYVNIEVVVHKHLYDAIISHLCRVEKWSLIEIVLLFPVDSERDTLSQHHERLILGRGLN